MSSTSSNRPVLRLGFSAIALSALLLSGCATLNSGGATGQPEVAVTEPEPKPQLPKEPPLPEVELTADLLYDLLVAEVAGQRGERDVSIDAVVKAANASEDPRLIARATREAIAVGNYEIALANAKKWVELRPDSNVPREALGIVYLGQADLENAEITLTSLVTDSKDLGQTYRRIADLMVRQDKRDGFLPILERLTAMNPDNADAWYSLAFFADRDDADDVADVAIGKALAIKPDWEDAALAKAGYLVQGDKADEYAAFTEAFLKRNPKATKYRLHYARTLVDQGKADEALEQFKAAAADDPDNVDATYAVGVLSLQREKYKQAATYLERVVKARPTHDQARLYLGQVSVALKDYKDAEQWYRSIRSDAYSFEAQRLIGVARADSGDVNDALVHLKSLAPHNDEDRIQLYLTQEQILMQAERGEEAKAVMDEALSAYPENADLLYARALVTASLEQIDEHERDLRALIKKEPNNAHAYNALGYTLADRTERYDEALELVAKALELRPGDPFIIDSMGWVHYRLGNYDKAREYLEQALETRADAEIAAHLGEVLWTMGEKEQARKIWKAARKESPDNKVLKDTIKKFID